MRSPLVLSLLSLLVLGACKHDAGATDGAPADARGEVQYLMDHEGLRYFPAVQARLARIDRDLNDGRITATAADESKRTYLREFKATHAAAMDTLRMMMPHGQIPPLKPLADSASLLVQPPQAAPAAAPAAPVAPEAAPVAQPQDTTHHG